MILKQYTLYIIYRGMIFFLIQFFQTSNNNLSKNYKIINILINYIKNSLTRITRYIFYILIKYIKIYSLVI